MPETLVWEGTDVQGNLVTGSHVVETVPTPILGQGYELVFKDDFDGPMDESVWRPSPWYANTAPWQVGHPARPKTEDGCLVIKCRQQENWAYIDVTSLGPPVSTYPRRPGAKVWQEGYFEARLKWTNDAWILPSFWMLSHESANCWPAQRNCAILNGEWDIMENGIGGPAGATADDRATTVLHRNTNAPCGVPDQMRHLYQNGSGYSNWHTWGGLWTSTALSLFCDGVLVKTLQPFDSTAQPMYINFDLRTRSESPAVGRLPEYRMDFDWIRVWQR